MADKKTTKTGTTEAFLHGWLKEVNWDKRTAQLHCPGKEYVLLRFQSELDREMLRFATRYVGVRGRGRLNKQDRWTSVRVESIHGDSRSYEPFDLDGFLDAPNPKIFDPETVVRASEPFDVDEFLRGIYEARNAGH